MVDCGVRCECHRRPSRHGNGLGAVSSSSHIAAEIVRGEISHRRIVVGVLSNVGIHGILDSIRSKGLEDIMARCLAGECCDANGQSCKTLHGDEMFKDIRDGA